MSGLQSLRGDDDFQLHLSSGETVSSPDSGSSSPWSGFSDFISQGEKDSGVFNTQQTSTAQGPSWIPGAVQGVTQGLLGAFGIGGTSKPASKPATSTSFLTSTPVLIGGAVLLALLLFRKKSA